MCQRDPPLECRIGSSGLSWLHLQAALPSRSQFSGGLSSPCQLATNFLKSRQAKSKPSLRRFDELLRPGTMIVSMDDHGVNGQPFQRLRDNRLPLVPNQESQRLLEFLSGPRIQQQDFQHSCTNLLKQGRSQALWKRS